MNTLRVAAFAAPGKPRRRHLALAAMAGVGLFAWTVHSVGPATLAVQLRALAPILPLLVALAAGRFLLQAAGWRLAMAPPQRPRWRETFAAVVAGEAAGYFGWGPVSREPMKALLVGHRIPVRAGLAAAVVERFMYAIAAATLVLVAIATVAVRSHHADWLVLGLAAMLALSVAARPFWRRLAGEARHHRMAIFGLVGLAAAQEVVNLVEAYLVLGWLGASPTLAAVVVLEGLGRLLGAAGQFIPGRLGVSEAATMVVAEGVRLGSAHGLSLALARRARSLVWGAVGIGLMALRAANWKLFLDDAISYLRRRGTPPDLPAGGLLHRASAE